MAIFRQHIHSSEQQNFIQQEQPYLDKFKQAVSSGKTKVDQNLNLMAWPGMFPQSE